MNIGAVFLQLRLVAWFNESLQAMMVKCMPASVAVGLVDWSPQGACHAAKHLGIFCGHCCPCVVWFVCKAAASRCLTATGSNQLRVFGCL